MSDFKVKEGIRVGSNGLIFSDGTQITSRNYSVNTITSNTTITLSDNGSVVTCNNTSAIYITVPNSTGLDTGFNFKIYPINSGDVYVKCAEATDKVATGTLRRAEVLLNRNAEVVKLANTIFALFE